MFRLPSHYLQALVRPSFTPGYDTRADISPSLSAASRRQQLLHYDSNNGKIGFSSRILRSPAAADAGGTLHCRTGHGFAVSALWPVWLQSVFSQQPVALGVGVWWVPFQPTSLPGTAAAAEPLHGAEPASDTLEAGKQQKDTLGPSPPQVLSAGLTSPGGWRGTGNLTSALASG